MNDGASRGWRPATRRRRFSTLFGSVGRLRDLGVAYCHGVFACTRSSPSLSKATLQAPHCFGDNSLGAGESEESMAVTGSSAV